MAFGVTPFFMSEDTRILAGKSVQTHESPLGGGLSRSTTNGSVKDSKSGWLGGSDSSRLSGVAGIQRTFRTLPGLRIGATRPKTKAGPSLFFAKGWPTDDEAVAKMGHPSDVGHPSGQMWATRPRVVANYNA
jgi:hypothetical protein